MTPTFGLWHDFRQRLPWAQGYAHFYGECIEQIEEAEALGYSHVWLSEHHFVDDGYLPAPLALAAALAGRTRRIGIGTNVLLLPLYHPLRVAEDAVLVDLVSDNRFTLGVGLGYVQHEFEMFGVERRFRPSLIEEGVAIIRRAWDEGRTGFAGKRWQLADLPFAPQPARRMPIFFGGYAEAAFERAARLADGFLVSANRGFEVIGRAHTALAEALPRYQRTIEGFPFVVSGTAYVHEDGEKAWDEVAPCIAYQLNRYAEWRTDRDQPAPAPLRAEDLDRSHYLIGTPDQVAARLIELYGRTPYTQFCYWGRLPGLNHEQAIGSMRLFMQKVVPQVLAAIQ